MVVLRGQHAGVPFLAGLSLRHGSACDLISAQVPTSTVLGVLLNLDLSQLREMEPTIVCK